MASTSSQTPSSSTSSSTPTKWDVFLSFHGKDTRYSFTSHLYSALDRHSIRTFMDDPELRCGEVISDALLQAIQESKAYIVVLSENYASSSWCLDELVEILSCSNTRHRLVIPLFYNIDPSIVRYQTGSFEEDFRRHEIRFDGEIERVKNWRVTLRQVGDKSGKHVDGKRSEADIVNEIVDEILLQIKPTVLDVARYPVGLNSRVDDITALLSGSTKGVVKIGIYGMGGVGKTTLAKALFNHLLLGSFKGSCFLANVREISGKKGLESLQQQLINDVLKSKNKVEVRTVDEGTKLIQSRICSTKILLVIDDLDDHKEFKSLVGPFASGSVVIITTRDEGTLDKVEVETKYRYRVNEMGDAESEKLFSRHAFGNTKPNNTLMILSKDILRLAGGLPLALVVFGSYLYKESEVSWKSYIETLQRNPNSTIQERLMISLNALESDDPLLKKMFLDIACFFIGSKREEVVEILDTYYPYAKVKIDILMKKCLLTINDYNEFRMHDLLQDVGKEIAHNNSPDEPGKYSRLWVPKDVCYVLEEHKGTEAIEGIMLHRFEPKDPFKEVSDPVKEVSFAMETFRRMSKLRFLSFDNKINLTGKFERTLEDLRWFCWRGCPLKCLPFDFRPQKIVILELPHSKMTTMWEVNKVPNAFDKLKTLNMSFSRDLTTTPNFRRLPCLIKLNFEGCRSLKEVHNSIGTLVSLVSLNLKYCSNLRSLPDTICNLRALEFLIIDCCIKVEALPIQLGNIKSLKELNAERLVVSKLPDSIGNLSKLVKLKLDHNQELECLPDTIFNLRALEVLSISYCTKVKELPEELGKIESLKELHAEGLAVLKLPDSIGYLSKLVKLNLDSNKKLESLPNTICNLRALESLTINSCTKVEALPVELGNIESLKKFHMSCTNVEALPDSICNLRALESLTINSCTKLEALPVESPKGFHMHVFKLPISKVPDNICNMRSLPDQLWKLTRLLQLDLSGAALLKKLPDIESSQTSLSLTLLDLSRSKITALPSGISQLSNLNILYLDGCDHLLSIAELPPNLTSISANDCTSLERLNISNLKLLEILMLTRCSTLTEILGLGDLNSLKRMNLSSCPSSLPALALTEPLFQKIYSGFEQEIGVYLESEKFPDWIIQSSVESVQTFSYDDSAEEFLDGSIQPDVDNDDSAAETSAWSSESILDLQPNLSIKCRINCTFQSSVDNDDLAEEFLDGSIQPDVDNGDSAEETSAWCSESIVDLSSTMKLQPNLSHNYLGMILCFEMFYDEEDEGEGLYYSVMTSATCNEDEGEGLYYSSSDKMLFGSSIVIVPRSIFSVTDADHTIKFTSNACRHWIRLLYKNEDDSTTVPSNVDLEVEEGGYPSKRLKLLESDKTGSVEMVEP